MKNTKTFLCENQFLGVRVGVAKRFLINRFSPRYICIHFN